MTDSLVSAAPSSLQGRGRRLFLPATVAVSAIAGCVALYAVDPNQPGNYPTCPWLALTGTWCAGCGTLRAIHALTHGDLGVAIARNPGTVIVAVWLVVAFGFWTRRRWQGRPRTWAAPGWAVLSLLWVLLAYWALRNVPGWTWLSPL